jgi:hypothetical protein
MARSLAPKALTGLAASMLVSSVALASDVTNGAKAAQGSLNGSITVNSIIGLVINLIMVFGCAMSVIVLIIGGLRYITSGGNASSVQGAKNTILYAIVGLVVSIAAYAIVSFVFTQFKIT